jgi:hypothetical protein
VSSYEETLTNITLEAAAGIAVDTQPPNEGSGFQYRILQVSGGHQADLYTAAIGEVPFGVLQNKPQVEGMAATVAVHGVSMIEAGGAIAAGDQVTGDANGLATTGSNPVIGVAIRAASAAGILVPVMLLIDGTAAA